MNLNKSKANNVPFLRLDTRKQKQQTVIRKNYKESLGLFWVQENMPALLGKINSQSTRLHANFCWPLYRQDAFFQPLLWTNFLIPTTTARITKRCKVVKLVGGHAYTQWETRCRWRPAGRVAPHNVTHTTWRRWQRSNSSEALSPSGALAQIEVRLPYFLYCKATWL